MEVLGGASSAKVAVARPDSTSEIELAMFDVLVDVSQNPSRRYFTNADGVAKCIHTATKLYSFRKDRIVLPFELMLLQGHPESMRIPDDMKCKELHDLAGEGICLPCLGLILTALMLSPGL